MFEDNKLDDLENKAYETKGRLEEKYDDAKEAFHEKLEEQQADKDYYDVE